jgi:dTDP-4-dehydrorhamnose 3,5-epimerase-like enzyme
MKKVLRFLFLLAFFVMLMIDNTSQAQAVTYDQYALLKGQRKVSIPFTFVHNFIILKVKLYGIVPVNLIYDTGAEHVIIFKKFYTDLLQVEYDKRVPVMGADLSRKIFALITRNAMLEIEGLAPKPYDLLIL